MWVLGIKLGYQVWQAVPLPDKPFHWFNPDTFIHKDPDIIYISLVVQAEMVNPRVIHDYTQKMMEVGLLINVETYFHSSNYFSTYSLPENSGF